MNNVSLESGVFFQTKIRFQNGATYPPIAPTVAPSNAVASETDRH